MSVDSKHTGAGRPDTAGQAAETLVSRISTHARQWTPPETQRTLPLEIGTYLKERFELLSVIGAGSIGVVYRALDHLHQEMEDGNPYVAIKILNERFREDQDALITLQREVRRAQLLAHENIIGVYSFDRDGPVVFMTMELLDGKTLREVIADSRDGLPAEDAVAVIRGMARALAYAHENGIVHSDVKPGNVFLTQQQRVKVLDFGVARGSVAGLPTGDSARVGTVGFTPAYASLQVIEGEDPLPADDVFALGVVAHELLTGQHPFDGGPTEAERLSQLRPAYRGLKRYQVKALNRALAGDRQERHASAADFLKDFDGAAAVRTFVRGGIAVAAVAAALAFANMRGNDPNPATAFDQLPVQTQAQFDAAIEEGETALGFGDSAINEALFYFSEAYALHPNNPRAIAGLETVSERFLGSIRTADLQTQRDVFELLYCQTYLRGHPPVTSTCNELLGAECEAIANRCALGGLE